MNDYLQLKKKIQQRFEVIEGIIRELEGPGLIDDAAASRWRQLLAQVDSSLQDSLIRIAVVGPVKSGKSTLINTLIGKDLLRRGAGIITAFITRILTGEDIGGWVELKPWYEVVDELNATVRMLPIFGEGFPEGDDLDIRKAEDRERLKSQLEKVRTEWQQVRGGLDPHFILLNGFLEGYQAVRNCMGDNVNRLIFDQHTLGQHQRYVGHEGQAVYVRDMELRHPVPWLGENVEIADCQGSDSPNPLHFEFLQQYLLKSHFVLYVINSRTGLREADFKLLDFIKTLRMFPQTFFLLNADMDVHPHAEDLERLVDRVRTELAWIVPNPRLYAFSALYHLYEQLGDSLADRDRRRLDLWKEDEYLSRFTESGFASFRDDMSRRITGQRARVLFGFGLSRLGMVAGSIMDNASARKALMDQDFGNLKKSAGQIKNRKRALEGTLATLENSISGLRDSLARELAVRVDRFFDPESGSIVRETLDMAEYCPIEAHYEKSLSDYRRLHRVLHHFYMEYRQTLARYIVEKVNLRAIEFAKSQEAFLRERLADASHAFWSLFATAIDDYRRDMANFHIELRTTSDFRECERPSLEKTAPPAFSAFMDRDATARGILMIKFGIGRLTRFLTGLKSRTGKTKDFLQRDAQDDETVREAISLVRSEARSELLRAFQTYCREFRDGYLFRILNTGTSSLLDEFNTRAEMTQFDFANLLKHSEVEGEARLGLMELLEGVSRTTRAMVEEFEDLRCAVNLEWLPPAEEASQPAEALSK